MLYSFIIQGHEGGNNFNLQTNSWEPFYGSSSPEVDVNEM